MGAGPHGLAAAAYLRHAGISTVIFGNPMEFWRDNMPAGMLLRSALRACNIASPDRALTLERWARERGHELRSPLPLEDFLEYAQWYLEQVAPDVDRRKVGSVERNNGSFRLALDDGGELHTRVVVAAAGIAPFPHIPDELASLPSELVSHSSAHNDLSTFKGRRVLVLGSGQSALESAALLHEEGAATVEVVFRAGSIWWLRGKAGGGLRWPSAPTDIGGPRSGWIAASPDLFRRLPRSKQDPLAYRCIRPAGGHWLRDRVRDIPLTSDRRLVSAAAENGHLRVTLNDGSDREVDHLLLGTGYKVDVRHYPFLGRGLVSSIEHVGGYPVLAPGLESSVAGLHFLGAPAAHSFGPVMRFVTGTWYSAAAMADRVRGRRQPLVRWSF